ncbi:MAG: ABC-F family ATP-binding cassette domain-containing protein, partial [Pseudomonadota bacterium]
MLAFHDITLMVAGRTLIEGASATVAAGHKVGVVGRNGTGKSTLFRAITGDLTLETGRIEVPRGARIGGVAQEAPATQDSLLNTVLAADTERAALMAEAETADASANPDRIAEVQTRLADIDAWSAPARAATILAGLGFDETAQARPCADFSGGWRMRVALAGVLFSAPDILLLDEPTNYLDLEGTLWLESYLARYPHTVLIVSHDRQLLNRSVGHILHLSEKRLTLYTGPYDSFDAQRRAQLAQAEAGIKKQEAARAHMQAFVDRFRYKASKAKQAQSRLKMIERMEPIAARLEGAVAGFAFPAPDTLSPPIIKLDGAATGYGDTQVLRSLSLRIDPDDRIALLGANGQGKSTLSKLIADRLPVMEGDVVKSSKLRIGYFAQHQVDELLVDETPLQHLARERPALPPARLRAILAAGGVTAEQADTSVAQLSGGQKARLSMLLATLDAPHVVILDEPTNHLDIESREALVTALMDYPGAVILVSHDPHLIGAVADRLWLVKDGTVRPFDDDLDAYATLLLTSRGSGGVAAKQERR